jgi:hypothetical protein
MTADLGVPEARSSWIPAALLENVGVVEIRVISVELKQRAAGATVVREAQDAGEPADAAGSR